MSANKGDKKVQDVKKKADEVADVARANIAMALARGEQLDVVVEKSDILDKNADKFRKGATRLKHHFCCQNIKLIGLGVSFVAVVILIIVLVAHPWN